MNAVGRTATPTTIRVIETGRAMTLSLAIEYNIYALYVTISIRGTKLVLSTINMSCVSLNYQIIASVSV